MRRWQCIFCRYYRARPWEAQGACGGRLDDDNDLRFGETETTNGVLVNTIHVVEPADQPPAAGQLAHGKYEFVSAFFQRQIYGIVFRIHDAKKSGVSEALRTSAAVKDFIVQKQANVIAISDIEFFDLIPIGDDRGPGINQLASLFAAQVVLEKSLAKVGTYRSPSGND